MGIVRFELHLPEELVKRIKTEAVATGVTSSAWALQVFLAAFEAQKPALVKERPSDPQIAFLEQVAENYHIGVAAGKAGVSIEQAQEWLAACPELQEQVGTCQEMYIEKVEQRLLAIGFGEAKGNWGALIAFLNAHHPQHGLKGELMSRILGDVIEQFYSVVVDQVGEDLANSIKALLKETAEKKLIAFKH